jgi:hypothetical protein
MENGVWWTIRKPNVRVYLGSVQRNLKLRWWENENRGWKQCWSHFFFAKGNIHYEFVLGKQVVIYNEAITRLIARVHGFRPEFQERGPWCLLHDNAPAHSSGAVSDFFPNEGFPCHPIHLAPLIWRRLAFLIFCIKNCNERDGIRGCSIDPSHCDRELKATSEEAFSAGIRFAVRAMQTLCRS